MNPEGWEAQHEADGMECGSIFLLLIPDADFSMLWWYVIEVKPGA
jgi:hypothetical protein